MLVSIPDSSMRPKTSISSHQEIVWILSIIAIVILWQMKKLDDGIAMLLGLIVLGIMLSKFNIISSQFRGLN